MGDIKKDKITEYTTTNPSDNNSKITTQKKTPKPHTTLGYDLQAEIRTISERNNSYLSGDDASDWF